MSGYNSVSYIISDMQKCIADITECHERVMTSFNQSMGEYYSNIHNIARYPSMYNSLEQRVSLHYAQIYHHSQFLNRAMSLVENIMNSVGVHNNISPLNNLNSAWRQASPPTDICGNNIQTPQDPIGTPLRSTDSLVQEMVASVLSTPPVSIRTNVPRNIVNTSSFNTLLSLLSNDTTLGGTSGSRNVFEFETIIPMIARRTRFDTEQPENLTYQQINEYTELVAYNSNDSTMTEQRCPITYEDFTEGEMVRRIRHCLHYFKDTAITGWLHNTRGVCPVCRHVLHSTRADDDEEENS